MLCILSRGLGLHKAREAGRKDKCARPVIIILKWQNNGWDFALLPMETSWSCINYISSLVKWKWDIRVIYMAWHPIIFATSYGLGASKSQVPCTLKGKGSHKSVSHLRSPWGAFATLSISHWIQSQPSSLISSIESKYDGTKHLFMVIFFIICHVL